MDTNWLDLLTTGVGAHLIYFATAIGAIMTFVAIYTAITPYREITLIREGNAAAAISLGGAILGYTCPLAQSVAQSGSLVDMLMWSAVALVAQLFAFGTAGNVHLNRYRKRCRDGGLNRHLIELNA